MQPGTQRITMLCHAANRAVRESAFPADEPLDVPGEQAAKELSGELPKIDRVRCAPSTACRQTAEALGLRVTGLTGPDTALDVEIDDGLRGCDYGRWAGLGLAEVEATEREHLLRWLTDPASAPHGGESIQQLITRVGNWLDALPGKPRRTLVIADAAVIRAAVVHAIVAKPDSFWRIDIPPLSTTMLSGSADRWRLRLGDPAGQHSG